MKQTQMVRGVVFSDLREARALPGAERRHLFIAKIGSVVSFIVLANILIR
jgi:hypothetical protein